MKSKNLICLNVCKLSVYPAMLSLNKLQWEHVIAILNQLLLRAFEVVKFFNFCNNIVWQKGPIDSVAFNDWFILKLRQGRLQTKTLALIDCLKIYINLRLRTDIRLRRTKHHLRLRILRLSKTKILLVNHLILRRIDILTKQLPMLYGHWTKNRPMGSK